MIYDSIKISCIRISLHFHDSLHVNLLDLSLTRLFLSSGILKSLFDVAIVCCCDMLKDVSNPGILNCSALYSRYM